MTSSMKELELDTVFRLSAGCDVPKEDLWKALPSAVGLLAYSTEGLRIHFHSRPFLKRPPSHGIQFVVKAATKRRDQVLHVSFHRVEEGVYLELDREHADLLIATLAMARGYEVEGFEPPAVVKHGKHLVAFYTDGRGCILQAMVLAGKSSVVTSARIDAATTRAALEWLASAYDWELEK